MLTQVTGGFIGHPSIVLRKIFNFLGFLKNKKIIKIPINFWSPYESCDPHQKVATLGFTSLQPQIFTI
jgi:hypothetical protein